MEAGSVEGILALSNEISKRDVRIRELEIDLKSKSEKAKRREAELQDELRASREEVERLRAEVKEKDMRLFRSNVEANFYREFYVLSKAKLRRFFTMVKDLECRSFLFTFIHNCLPDNTPSDVNLELEKMMMLPTSEEPTMVTNNYNAPIGQQINHANEVTQNVEEQDNGEAKHHE